MKGYLVLFLGIGLLMINASTFGAGITNLADLYASGSGGSIKLGDIYADACKNGGRPIFCNLNAAFCTLVNEERLRIYNECEWKKWLETRKLDVDKQRITILLALKSNPCAYVTSGRELFFYVPGNLIISTPSGLPSLHIKKFINDKDVSEWLPNIIRDLNNGTYRERREAYDYCLSEYLTRIKSNPCRENCLLFGSAFGGFHALVCEAEGKRNCPQLSKLLNTVKCAFDLDNQSHDGETVDFQCSSATPQKTITMEPGFRNGK